MGMLRLFLALCVVAAHTTPLYLYFPTGRAAVVLFYIMSGFYMAMILNTRYADPHKNNIFYLNRFLRLWVPYCVVLALTLLIALFLPILSSLPGALQQAPWGLKIFAVLSNIFIVGQDFFWLIAYNPSGMHYQPYGVSPLANGYNLMVNLPLFTVAIEIMFYVIAPYVLRSIKTTILFLYAGLAWYGVMAIFQYTGLDAQYHLFPSSFLYFGLGAIVWWVGQRPETLTLPMKILLCLAAAGILFIPQMLNGRMLLVFCFVFYGLFLVFRHIEWDRLLGDLSYGVYITHWPIMKIMVYFGLNGQHLALATFALSVLCATLLYYFIDRPLTLWRHARIEKTRLQTTP